MAQTHEAAFFFEPNELSKKFEALKTGQELETSELLNG